MRILSLYCGAGGIDQGLKQAGLETTTAIDFNSDACETMRLNHPNTEVICSSVEDQISTLGKYDIIVGGPPCQPFSRANTGRTLDPRNVNTFWRIVENIKPKYFLMENVRDVEKVCDKHNVLINCADYGTPQKRIRRVFTNIKIPNPTHYEYPIGKQKKWVSVGEALGLQGDIQDRKTTFGERPGRGGSYRTRPTTRPCFTIVTDFRVWYISSTGFSHCNMKVKTKPITEPSPTVVIANGLKLTDYEIPSKKYDRDWKPPKDGLERRLTNQECAILQGFPKTYQFFGSVQSVKTQIGNAVPPQPIECIFNEIKA